MTRKEILAELQQWQDTQQALDAQLDLLYDLVGCQPDSPLLHAIYRMSEAYTDAVSQAVGDEGEWLSWWQFECQYGAKQMSAAKAGCKLRLISNLKQLAGLISE